MPLAINDMSLFNYQSFSFVAVHKIMMCLSMDSTLDLMT